jgi:hypothetical protein
MAAHTWRSNSWLIPSWTLKKKIVMMKQLSKFKLSRLRRGLERSEDYLKNWESNGETKSPLKNDTKSLWKTIRISSLTFRKLYLKMLEHIMLDLFPFKLTRQILQISQLHMIHLKIILQVTNTLGECHLQALV